MKVKIICTRYGWQVWNVATNDLAYWQHLKSAKSLVAFVNFHGYSVVNRDCFSLSHLFQN